MNEFVLDLAEVDRDRTAEVGGKGANLGELCRLPGVDVPTGFCVTTGAYDLMLAATPGLDELLDRLASVTAADRAVIADLSARVRAAVEATPIPDELAKPIAEAVTRFGAEHGYAVRSSATAEDLPTASFAGQQDSYLNIVGPEAIGEHVRRCWASLFTERAVSYRAHNGFDHRRVRMAVVVQRMVAARAAGVLFTVDPVTSNRTVTTVEATVGLGESLVSGQVNADVHRVVDGVVTTTVGDKSLAVEEVPGGGTRQRPVETATRNRPALTDDQVLELARLGRRIEARFGRPQDIEWCLTDEGFHIVQARPITTLFPIPETDDEANHVYLSVGHQQMMTEAMKPLGLSVWQLTTPRRMAEAGGRLFVDVSPVVAAPAGRTKLLATMSQSDPLMGDALRTVLDRDFIPLAPEDGPAWEPPGGGDTVPTDPQLVPELIERGKASLAATRRDIATKSGVELFDFVLADIRVLRQQLVETRTIQVIMAGMEATWWLNDHMSTWLGDKNAADAINQSVPHNVTAEMGLALLDVADAIRPHPEVVAFLREVDDDGFLERLPDLDGGTEAARAIRDYLDDYGMRCVGEIDITRPRWSENPAALVPMILANVDTFEPGEAARRFALGREQSLRKEAELLERLRELPDGEAKAAQTKDRIDRVRLFAGFREFPKYGMISRYLMYKRALLAEAGKLVRAGALAETADAFFLSFDELREAVATGLVDRELIAGRRADFEWYETLTPPRVLTSDGEAVRGSYHREDLPADALVGLPVSAGTIEGRARVILDMAHADPQPGDILVTTHTDPSWSPLFVAIAGLVTEVGGQMTHGAVIAREYGLPAVVGVDGATGYIKDGQRIRVNGTEGFIEILG